MINGLGLDIVAISRFKQFKKRQDAFISKVFSKLEIDYCFSFRDPAPHLAGIFAAKEAVVKACGGKRVNITDVAILHLKSGKPLVFIKGKKAHRVLVSITHTEKIAAAIAALL